MANRNFPSSRLYSNHNMLVSLDAKVSIGASGAPTLASAKYGIASISRSSAGKYLITLSDAFPGGLIVMKVLMKSVDTSNPSGIVTVDLVSETVSTDGKINVVCLAPSFAGSALGTHTHTMTPAGTNDSSTPPVFTGTLGTTSATSAGTPAGTMSLVAADPANGSQMIIQILVNNSSQQ